MDVTALIVGGFIDQYIYYNIQTRNSAGLRAAAEIRFGPIPNDVYDAAYQIAQQSRQAGTRINAPNRKQPLLPNAYPGVSGYFSQQTFGEAQYRYRVDVTYDRPGGGGEQGTYTVYVDWKYSADPEMLHRAAIEEFIRQNGSTGYSTGRVGYGDVNRTDVIYGFRGT